MRGAAAALFTSPPEPPRGPPPPPGGSSPRYPPRRGARGRARWPPSGAPGASPLGIFSGGNLPQLALYTRPPGGRALAADAPSRQRGWGGTATCCILPLLELQRGSVFGPRYREGHTGQSLAGLAGSLSAGPNLATKPANRSMLGLPLPPHRGGPGLPWHPSGPPPLPSPHRSSSPTIASMVSLKTPTAVSPRRLSSNVHR